MRIEYLNGWIEEGHISRFLERIKREEMIEVMPILKTEPVIKEEAMISE